MRLLSFTLPNDPLPRTGVLAHDQARVIDLTEIGIASFADAVERSGELRRVASHLLHMPGAVAYPPDAVRLAAPSRRLVAVYDAATGVPAVVLAGTAYGAVEPIASGTDAAVPLGAEMEYGAGLACIVGLRAESIDPADAEAHVAALAPVSCWRGGPHRIEAAAIGPAAVTLDELAPWRTGPLAYSIDAAVAVNREVLRGGAWAALSAKLAAAVADASRRAPLEAGDAVAVATFELGHERRGRPDAVPQGRPATTPGDEVVLEVQQLGSLRSWVAPR